MENWGNWMTYLSVSDAYFYYICLFIKMQNPLQWFFVKKAQSLPQDLPARVDASGIAVPGPKSPPRDRESSPSPSRKKLKRFATSIRPPIFWLLINTYLCLLHFPSPSLLHSLPFSSFFSGLHKQFRKTSELGPIASNWSWSHFFAIILGRLAG